MKMYPPRRVGRDTGELTDEELRYIHQELIDAAVPELHGRDVYQREPLPSVGIRTIRSYTKTSMSQAVLSMEAEMVSVDRIQLASGDINVPAIYKDFIVNWRDIEAIRDFGGSLEMENGRDAARQVAEEENKLLLSGEYAGWPALGIQGLLSSTLRNSTGGGAWPANAIANVNAAIAELESDGHTKGPYYLLGRVAQVRKLDGQVSNTNTTYRQFLLANKIVDAIIGDDSLYTTAGATTSAVVCEVDKKNFALKIAQDITERPSPLPNGDIFVRVFEVCTPHIKRPTSICELTGLS
jgi:uncharacterized linocin/CFP29 family protein